MWVVGWVGWLVRITHKNVYSLNLSWVQAGVSFYSRSVHKTVYLYTSTIGSTNVCTLQVGKAKCVRTAFYHVAVIVSHHKVLKVTSLLSPANSHPYLACLAMLFAFLGSKLRAKSFTTFLRSSSVASWHLTMWAMAWDQKEKSMGLRSGD